MYEEPIFFKKNYRRLNKNRLSSTTCGEDLLKNDKELKDFAKKCEKMVDITSRFFYLQNYYKIIFDLIRLQKLEVGYFFVSRNFLSEHPSFGP